jgi:SUN domain-containing protein 1/2
MASLDNCSVFLCRLLVSGSYNNSLGAPAMQTFPVRDDSHRFSDEPYQTLRLRIVSNHGHPDYTCLYRFRVHGNAVP